MNPGLPPPLPQGYRDSVKRRRRLGIGLGVVVIGLLSILITLRITGLLRPFSIPTGAMSPAVSPGDHIIMEGMTYLFREPRRGDIAVFKTDGIAAVPPAQFYVKRIAGEPGDRLRISDGKLSINGREMKLSNAVGRIVYGLPQGWEAKAPNTDLTIPDGHYFVLGDNTTNSYDSRFWGTVPRDNIKGRVLFRYWPPHRTGRVD